jgi:hypothetical protein
VRDPSAPSDTLDGYCLAEEVIHALACGGLEESQRSQALAHLDDCELCQALLADEVRALPQSPSAEDAGLPTLIQIDALVAGRYRIKRFVARGGMGEVYEAWDVLLAERVALKTINPLAASADQLKAGARFKQEVQLSRRVADPHVCRMYEFGQHLVRGFGTLSYLTMEFIEGQTLGARLRHGPPLRMDEVVALSRQMLRGLAAAHGVGVLHRDFKSDNVMLRAESPLHGSLHAVVMDFGLARVLGDQAHRLTERHELVGSAAYMAPEQLEEGAGLSEATDIYAFGVVLFEMLTGHLPFEGKSAVAVALKRLTQPAPPPSMHLPELAGAWDALVLRCLERDVARRFTSTDQVAAALDNLASEPGLVRVAAAPRSRTRQRLVLGLGVAAAVLVAGTAQLVASRANDDAAPRQPPATGAAAAAATPSITHSLQPGVPDRPLATELPVSPRLEPLEPAAPAAPPPAESTSEPPRAPAPRARAARSTRAPAAPATPPPAATPPAAPRPADVREVFFLENPADQPGAD